MCELSPFALGGPEGWYQLEYKSSLSPRRDNNDIQGYLFCQPDDTEKVVGITSRYTKNMLEHNLCFLHAQSVDIQRDLSETFHIDKVIIFRPDLMLLFCYRITELEQVKVQCSQPSRPTAGDGSAV